MIVCKSKPSAARIWGEKEQKRSDGQVSLSKAQQDPLCSDLAIGQQFLLFKFVVDTGQ